MPSTRVLARAGSTIAILAFAGVATAQSPHAGSELGLGARIGIRFGVIFVINLVLGGLLVALGPRYATETVTALRNDPGGAFLWGLLVGIGVPICLAILAITIVGLIVAIPGFIILAIVGVVGNAVTVLWVGDAIFGASDAADGIVLGGGALILALLGAIPVLGNLLTTVVGFFGLGIVSRRLYESR